MARSNALDPLDATAPAALETAPAPLEARPRLLRTLSFEMSLFWRTFLLLSLLLLGSMVAWLQTIQAVEYAPRAAQTANQIAALANISGAALVHAEPQQRPALIRQLARLEGVRIVPREPGDRFEPAAVDSTSRRIAEELIVRLGPGTEVARSVNGEDGLWVGFSMAGDKFWMLLDPGRVGPVRSTAWLAWAITAVVLSLAGAALIARLINRPLKELSFAASRVREGDFTGSQLDERAMTSEIRQVNMGFNRMAQQLSKIEQDRAVMLAGISHDLRTPLARLRLETEISVPDETARMHMAADIDQLDGIIDKFLDYARPDQARLVPVCVNDVIDATVFSLQHGDDLRLRLSMDEEVWVMADEVELARVLANLIENARRYGRSPGTQTTQVEISVRQRDGMVLIKVRDRGPGVPPDMLASLTKPFFRGDAARTAATGAGLGLAIVEKTVQRMGGRFQLANGRSSGLVALIRLRSATQMA